MKILFTFSTEKKMFWTNKRFAILEVCFLDFHEQIIMICIIPNYRDIIPKYRTNGHEQVSWEEIQFIT